MKIQFLTFEQYHGKKEVGSTRLRVHQLIKHWPGASLYRYGDAPDVLIFQKVYATADYKFPLSYKGIKILDIADPDWLDLVALRETCDQIDAVVCCTEALAEFVRQVTDKPVVVIPDRHDLELVPAKPKQHTKTAKKLVWFGYRHNADVLRPVIRRYEDSDYQLTLITNEDPVLERAAAEPKKWRNRLHYEVFDSATLYERLRRHDIALLPDGTRPTDRFKSDNKTIIARLAGLPVAKTPEDLAAFADPDERNADVLSRWEKTCQDYDVKLSVSDYVNLIQMIERS